MNQKKTEPKKVKICDYENGIYQGIFSNFIKHEIGIYYWDIGYLYIGEWSRNKIQGKGALFFPDGSMLYGVLENGTLNGLTVIQLYSGDIVVGNWIKNKQNGDFYYFIKEMLCWICANYSNENGKSIMKINSTEFVKSLNDFPNLFNQNDEIRNLVFGNIFKLTYEKIQKHSNLGLKYIQLNENSEFLGFVVKNHPNGLGIFKNKDKMICFGKFENGILNGLGRVIKNDEVYDGCFKEGYLDKIGCYYNKITEKFIIGNFKENICEEILQSDKEYKIKKLNQSKLEIHKKNKNFLAENFNCDLLIILSSINLKVTNLEENEIKLLEREKSIIEKIEIYNDQRDSQNKYYEDYIFQSKKSDIKENNKEKPKSTKSSPLKLNPTKKIETIINLNEKFKDEVTIPEIYEEIQINLEIFNSEFYPLRHCLKNQFFEIDEKIYNLKENNNEIQSNKKIESIAHSRNNLDESIYVRNQVYFSEKNNENFIKNQLNINKNSLSEFDNSNLFLQIYNQIQTLGYSNVALLKSESEIEEKKSIDSSSNTEDDERIPFSTKIIN